MTSFEQTDSQNHERRTHLVSLMEDRPIAMFTTLGAEGPRSVPMSRQEVEPDAEMWFISARDTRTPARRPTTPPRADLLLARRLGRADRPGPPRRRHRQAARSVEHLRRGLAARRTGGPGRRADPGRRGPRGVLGHPGRGKVASLLSFAKVKLTGDTYDARHATAEP